jgi:hypothetical protein
MPLPRESVHVAHRDIHFAGNWEKTSGLISEQLTVKLAFMTVNGPGSSVHFTLAVMMIVGCLRMAQRCPMAHSDPCCWLLFDLWFTPEAIFVSHRVQSKPILVFPPHASMAQHAAIAILQDSGAVLAY